MERRWTAGIVAIAGALAMACTGTATPPPPSAPPAPTPTLSAAPTISSGDAIAAVQEFAPGSLDLQADLVPAGPPCSCYKVEGREVRGFVDTASGNVVVLFLSAAAPVDSTVTFADGGAIAAAQRFLDTHRIPIPQASPTVELRDHGETNEYQVIWQRRVNGTKVPDAVTLSVNPRTATVYSFTRSIRPWADPPTPAVSLEQAIEAAKVAAGPGLTEVHSSDLVVAFDFDGTQRLIWEIELESGQPSRPAYAMVGVDAITGAATVLGRG